MARPLQIEYSGALYHVTARGNAREDIFRSDEDRLSFLNVLSSTTSKYNWLCHAYCLMDITLPPRHRNTRPQPVPLHAATQRGLYPDFQSHSPAGWPYFPGALQIHQQSGWRETEKVIFQDLAPIS